MAKKICGKFNTVKEVCDHYGLDIYRWRYYSKFYPGMTPEEKLKYLLENKLPPNKYRMRGKKYKHISLDKSSLQKRIRPGFYVFDMEPINIRKTNY